MEHVRVSDEYINFALMYMTDNILPVLPIKHLVNQDGEPTTQHRLATVKKLQYQNYGVYSVCVFKKKATAHVDKKALNMCHQPQKGFCGIFVGIIQHQKGYIVYIPITRKIVSSHGVVFDETISSALSYTSCPYSEALTMQLSVSYIRYAISYHEQTGDIITFVHFEEGYLVENEYTRLIVA